MASNQEVSRKALLLRLILNGKVLRTFAFDQDVVRIGRDARADVHLVGAGISRLHCKLERLNDTVALVDNGSTNGTWVDAKRVRYEELKSGDVVRIGVFELHVFFVSTRHDNLFAPGEASSSPTLRMP